MEKNNFRKLEAKLLLTSVLLGGCKGGEIQNPEIGDTGVVGIRMEGVMDYNQIKIDKDTCVMESGTVYKVIDKSTLTLPSTRNCYYDKSTDRNECYYESNKQPIIQLEGDNGCTAWYSTSEVIESTDLDNK
jgi:hypothetical protein